MTFRPSYLRPFPPTSLWRQTIPADAELDPQNAARVRFFNRSVLRYPQVTNVEWGVAIYRVGPTYSGPREDVTITKFTKRTMRGIPVPAHALPDSSDDGHLAIYDATSNTEYGFWKFDRGRLRAGAGAAVSLDFDGIVPPDTVGANAANFPLLGGLLRPGDFANRALGHALVFGCDRISNNRTPLWPSPLGSKGSEADELAVREGELIRLDPRVDVSALPPHEQRIARCLQKYGAYCRDGSGATVIYAQSNAALLWLGIFGRSGNYRFSAEFNRIVWPNIQFVVAEAA